MKFKGVKMPLIGARVKKIKKGPKFIRKPLYGPKIKPLAKDAGIKKKVVETKEYKGVIETKDFSGVSVKKLAEQISTLTMAELEKIINSDGRKTAITLAKEELAKR
jgi:hypothetical protein